MIEREGYNEDVVKTIKQKITFLKWVVSLIVLIVVFITLKFLFSFLDYVPLQSVIILLAVTIGLVVAGFLIMGTTSKSAIAAIEEFSRKLSALLTTAKDVHEIVYSDVLLDRIIDVSTEIAGARAGSIFLLEGESLVSKAFKAEDSKKGAQGSFPKSQGIAGWVSENGRAVRTDNAKSDARFYSGIDAPGFETRSILCVPLRSSKGVMGVIELFNKKDGPFTSEDEEFISYFAEQAAIALEKAKFYEDETNYQIHLTNILIDAMEYMPEKHGHSRRIAKYTIVMANELDMPETEKKRLYQASLLHDIGFLKIGHDVTSLDEFRKHPALGYEMLQPINFYSSIAPIVLHHHERYDGGGYPSGLRGDFIPLESRMIYIAEAFDAIASGHSYKKIGKLLIHDAIYPALGFGEAIEELRKNAGTQFDPRLVEVFVNNITEDNL